MTRWAFVRGDAVRLSRAGLTMPGDDTTRAPLSGDMPDRPQLTLKGEGACLPCPDCKGETWGYVGKVFIVPPDQAPRLMIGTEFLALFTPAEVAALWASGPEFMVAALHVASQNLVNLDSPDLRGLLALAVARYALSPGRLERVAQGLPPA